MNYHSQHTIHLQAVRGYLPVATYPQHTPPYKRPRTDLRNVNATKSADRSNRHGAQQSDRSTPNKTTPTRKTFSDFRISTITIGTWTSDESKEEGDPRDSRIRFCFRNASDRDPDPTLSAIESALVTPDRLSISVARGTERIVIPAHHIKKIDFARTDGMITIETDGWAAFEIASETTQARDGTGSLCNGDPPGLATSQWSSTEADITRGQLSSSKRIQIRLNQQRPLTEPKWTRGCLEHHIDVSSRFLKILNMVDVDPAPSFDGFLNHWAGNDGGKAYFHEFHFSATRMVTLLTGLMSASNILTPSIQCVISGMLDLIQVSDVPEAELTSLLKQALFLVPQHMISKALDTAYDDFVNEDMNLHHSTSALVLESTLGGSKRQRGESEVPSEQLARTTLDEKRRRLSDSEPQVPNEKDLGTSGPQSRLRGRSRTRTVLTADKQASRTEVRVAKSSATRIGIGRPSTSGARLPHDETDDGARMSREEMLRNLEAVEDDLSSSEVGQDEEDVPVESASLMVQPAEDT